jgi:hypothetical protein
MKASIGMPGTSLTLPSSFIAVSLARPTDHQQDAADLRQQRQQHQDGMAKPSAPGLVVPALSQATILLAASACGSAACSTGIERALALGHGLLALAKEAADPA